MIGGSIFAGVEGGMNESILWRSVVGPSITCAIEA